MIQASRVTDREAFQQLYMPAHVKMMSFGSPVDQVRERV